MLEQYREQLAEARHEAARLREEAREQGAQIIAEMREQARPRRSASSTEAHTQIEADRQQAFTSLRADVGQARHRPGRQLVGESLEDEARQSRTVDRFLDELEDRARAEALMNGASRASLGEARERLDAVLPSGDAATLADELAAVAALLDRETCCGGP